MANFKPNKKGIIKGTENKDKISWKKDWSKNLTVKALFGDDTIDFKKSKYKNKLYGDGGNDTINGGTANDTIKGGSGNDKLYGGKGNDLIKAGIGDDYIEGGYGNDKIYGEYGINTLKGGPGNDSIFGGISYDFIFGGADDDKIVGNGGDDYINGGKGKNNICFNIGDGHDIVESGKGTDTLIFQNEVSVYWNYKGNDAIVYYGNKSDTVTLKNYKKITHSAKYVKIGDIKFSLKNIRNLSKGSELKSYTIKSSDPLRIVLKNPFNGKNYGYNITTSLKSQKINILFLENGRLAIQGDYLTITADKGQKDDITIWGSRNTINTGNGKDIVRVGGAIDSAFEVKYFKQSDYNTINTGSGDDYVVYYGYGNKINMGPGNDYALSILSPKTNVSAEVVRDIYNNTPNSLDGKIGHFNQGAKGGDCRLLALLQSLSKQSSKLSDFVSISKSGNDYSVTFKNYTGGTKSVKITQNELSNFGNVFGDLDVVLTDFAMNKLLKINKDYGMTNVADAYYNTIGKYVFGNENFTYVDSLDNNYKTKMETLWQEYCKKNISNISVGIFSDDNYKLGIIGGHAYAIDNITKDYISLINVWDSGDILNLDIDTFYSLDTATFVYGSGYYGNTYLSNGSYTTPDEFTQELKSDVASWNASSIDKSLNTVSDYSDKNSSDLLTAYFVNDNFQNAI